MSDDQPHPIRTLAELRDRYTPIGDTEQEAGE